MAHSTSQKILTYIEKNGQARGKELLDHLGTIGARAVRKQLRNLLEKKALQKIGRPPKVYYLLSKPTYDAKSITVSQDIRSIIDSRYVYISPSGMFLTGWEGFVSWCIKTKQDPIQIAQEYIKTVRKFDRFRKGNLIDGMEKMRLTFDEVFLDRSYYLDFYSIERFGKTKLGQMLLYAKQSQNTVLIRQLIDQILHQITQVVREHDIDGILFIPPTVKREVQLMRELEKKAQFIGVRGISVAKIKTDVAVPQKTLTKLEDRIENARQTIIVEDSRLFKNILLIDDAIGSGATLNETAKQIKKRKLCTGNIIGLAITGSFKGFDVISEV